MNAPYDPGELLHYFPLVRLKPGYRLDTYQYLARPDGNGFVFAVPADRRLPPPPEGLDLAWQRGIIPIPRTGGLPPLGPGEATVRFYTATRYVQEELCRHVDTDSDGARVDQTSRTAAVGGMGYIY